MGDHKTNGVALAHAARPAMPKEVYGFAFEVSLEFNRETMDEINAIGRTTEMSGGDPRKAIHLATMEWNKEDHPERWDYVVYNQVQIGRPSVLMPNQVPTATLRFGEHLRKPLLEVRRRADASFAAAREATQAQSQ